MSRKNKELVQYRNQKLMDDINEMFITFKRQLPFLQTNMVKPTIAEVNILHLKIHYILMQDSKLIRK